MKWALRICGLIKKILPKIVTWEEVRQQILDTIEENGRKQYGKEKDGSPQNTI